MTAPTGIDLEARTDTDYAIEFGEYLAKAAESYMQAVADYGADDPDATNDAWDALRSAIYEFRKRAIKARALAASQAEQIAGMREALKAAQLAERVAHEELAEERHAHSQFGVGA